MVGIIRANVDPCLNMKKSAKGIIYIDLFVNNNFIVGNCETIDEAIEALWGNGLVLKVIEILKDYLSCELMFSLDKRGLD